MLVNFTYYPPNWPKNLDTLHHCLPDIVVYFWDVPARGGWFHCKGFTATEFNYAYGGGNHVLWRYKILQQCKNVGGSIAKGPLWQKSTMPMVDAIVFYENIKYIATKSECGWFHIKGSTVTEFNYAYGGCNYMLWKYEKLQQYQNLKAYSLMLNRGRSQNFQNWIFLYIYFGWHPLTFVCFVLYLKQVICKALVSLKLQIKLWCITD